MRALDLMSEPVVTVRPETPAKQAAGLLSRHGFTALPVVDEDDQLIGIVTEADLIAERIPVDPRYRGNGHRRPGETVADVMTSPVTGMSAGTDLAVLARALLSAQIRAMPIVDGSRVVGIVTRGDIVGIFARSDREIAADVLHRLQIYGGADRWQVEVNDGNVRIVDAYEAADDRLIAARLAESVPGVVSAVVGAAAA